MTAALGFGPVASVRIVIGDGGTWNGKRGAASETAYGYTEGTKL
jgi:hypothetical protein